MTGYSKIKLKKKLPKYDEGGSTPFYRDPEQLVGRQAGVAIDNTKITGTPVNVTIPQNYSGNSQGNFFSSNAGAVGGGLNFLGDTVNTLIPTDPTSKGSIYTGALSSGLKGAAAGTAVLPGIGTAVGGAIGLASGIIGGSAKRNQALKQRTLRQDQIGQQAQRQSNQVLSQYDTTGVEGSQLYADGGIIDYGLDDDPKHPKKRTTAQMQPTYDASLLTNGKFMVTKPDGTQGQWGNPLPTLNNYQSNPQNISNQPVILPSDKALGYSNTYYPSRGQQTGQSVPTQYRSSYANGGTLKKNLNVDYPIFPLMAEGGDLSIAPSHKGRFNAYLKRTGKTAHEALNSSDPHVRKMANYAINIGHTKKAYGGNTEEQPYEAEKNEVVQGNPQLEQSNQLSNDMHLVGGDTHEDGGTMGVGGDRIFSDRLKISSQLKDALKSAGISVSKDSTYADVSNKIGRLKGKFEDKTNPIGLNTAKVMLPRLEQTLDATFNDQEMGKQVKAYKKFAYGGTPYRNPDTIAATPDYNVDVDTSIDGNPVNANIVPSYQGSTTLTPKTFWDKVGSTAGQVGNSVLDYTKNNTGQVANAASYLANMGTINKLDTSVNRQYLSSPNYNYTDRSGVAYNRNNSLLRTGVRSLTNAGQTVNAANIGGLYSKELEGNSSIALNEAARRDSYNNNYNERADKISAVNAGIANEASDSQRDLNNQKTALKLGARNAFLSGVQGNIASKEASELENKKLLTILAANDQNGVMTRFLKNYPTYKTLLKNYQTAS